MLMTAVSLQRKTGEGLLTPLTPHLAWASGLTSRRSQLFGKKGPRYKNEKQHLVPKEVSLPVTPGLLD